MTLSKELQIGKVGEYLVCADLILKDFVAFPSEQGLPYDVLLDNGKKLLKVQVKTTLGPRVVPQRSKNSVAYIFNKRCGKKNASKHSTKDVDLYALVCLDTKQIGYVQEQDMPTSINIRVDSLKGSYHDEKGIQDYQTVMKLKNSMSQTEISKATGLAIATVNRMCQPKYKPFSTNARYFSEFLREREWFIEL